MIHVSLQPEPKDFDSQVRQPGLRAIDEFRGQKDLPPRRGRPRKKKLNFKAEDLSPYWQNCLNDLHKAYQGICAYLCLYIPKAVGARTVDHFVAKSASVAILSKTNDPAQVYEWRNYRLACSLMNTRKSKFNDVLDPFKVEDGWFILEFSGLQVIPNPDLPHKIRRKVLETIERLGLNDDECLEARGEYFDEYINHHVDFSFLKRRSPFVAREMLRQGLAQKEDRQ